LTKLNSTATKNKEQHKKPSNYRPIEKVFSRFAETRFAEVRVRVRVRVRLRVRLRVRV